MFTAIIQSSGATTVMVVSFVNAGIMTLAQSVGIIFGANIGTTITSQLVAFNLTGVAPFILFVGEAPNSTATILFFVMASKMERSLAPAAFCKPWLIKFIPNKNNPRPPSKFNINSM